MLARARKVKRDRSIFPPMLIDWNVSLDYVVIPMAKHRSGNGQTDSEHLLDQLVIDHLPDLLSAAVRGDAYRSVVATRRFLAQLYDVRPDLADKLNRGIIGSDVAGNDAMRKIASPPIDLESAAPLARHIDCSTAIRPVLPEAAHRAIDQLLNEQKSAEILVRAGISPRSTILLTGAPGTGKTMLASWIARQFNAPLVGMELSLAISSFLGRTGQNLKEILDYARANRIVLLLDEFDAIAKRRDDVVDIGELKRIVSVLLKELEEWPGPSVVIAATNHPALIDPAAFRRFHLVIDISLPDAEATAAILVMHLDPERPSDSMIELAAQTLAGMSGSEVRNVAYDARRSMYLNRVKTIDESILRQLPPYLKTKKQRQAFAKLAQRTLPRRQTSSAAIARLLHVGKTTAFRYLREESED